MVHINDYIAIVGNEIIESLYIIAEKLKGFKIQNILS